MNFIFGSVTNVGISRDTNQDGYYIAELSTVIGPMVLVAVCDGMGGFSKGELASATVIEALRSWVKKDLSELLRSGELVDSDLRSSLEGMIQRTNHLIFTYGLSEGIRLGSTVCMVLMTPNRYYSMNVGDSRMVCLSTAGVSTITRDHSLVYEEYLAGRLSKEEIEHDPRSNILTRSVGVYQEVIPDFFFGTPKPGEIYLLCSDGGHHMITEADLMETLIHNPVVTHQQITEGLSCLVNLAMNRGETDNLTMAALGVVYD